MVSLPRRSRNSDARTPSPVELSPIGNGRRRTILTHRTMHTSTSRLRSGDQGEPVYRRTHQAAQAPDRGGMGRTGMLPERGPQRLEVGVDNPKGCAVQRERRVEAARGQGQDPELLAQRTAQLAVAQRPLALPRASATAGRVVQQQAPLEAGLPSGRGDLGALHRAEHLAHPGGLDLDCHQTRVHHARHPASPRSPTPRPPATRSDGRRSRLRATLARPALTGPQRGIPVALQCAPLAVAGLLRRGVQYLFRSRSGHRDASPARLFEARRAHSPLRVGCGEDRSIVTSGFRRSV